jgi:hypothetical protein
MSFSASTQRTSSKKGGDVAALHGRSPHWTSDGRTAGRQTSCHPRCCLTEWTSPSGIYTALHRWREESCSRQPSAADQALSLSPDQPVGTERAKATRTSRSVLPHRTTRRCEANPTDPSGNAVAGSDIKRLTTERAVTTRTSRSVLHIKQPVDVERTRTTRRGIQLSCRTSTSDDRARLIAYDKSNPTCQRSNRRL